MKKKCYLMAIVLLVSVMFIYPVNKVYAYVLNNQKMNHPNMVYVLKDTTTGSYNSDINAYKTWANYSGSPFGFLEVSTNQNISIGVENKSNGNYGVFYPDTPDRGRIVFYKAWIDANTSIRKETVVHEFGHALGLSHTQNSNVSIAVMRAIDFNGKAYPLSDDISGIKAKY